MKAMLMAAALVLGALTAHAEQKLKMYFVNEDIVKLIEIYSKASGDKFILDPSVRGKVTILNQQEVSLEEAYNQLSTTLALNGYAIVKEGDTKVVMTARNAQRSLTEVGSELPPLKPERMYTLVVNLKHVAASQINRDLRILTSKDGEMTVNENANQVIISDWLSNLYRVVEIFKQTDRPADPSVIKLVEAAKKEREAHRIEAANKPKPSHKEEPGLKE